MITLENGNTIEPTDETPVECLAHGVRTTWGKLDAIQRLAVETGIDTTDDLDCILSACNGGSS